MMEQLKKVTTMGKVSTGRALRGVSAAAIFIAVLGALIGFMAGGCGGRTASELPFGNVDTPKPGTAVKGSVRVSGWALSHARIDRVEAYLDRKPAGSCAAGVSRPDVQAAYPDYPDSGKAGFDFQLDLTGKQAGAHELTVQVRSSDDAVRELCNFPIHISP